MQSLFEFRSTPKNSKSFEEGGEGKEIENRGERERGK